MLHFLFDPGFDGLTPGRSGERLRAGRAARTLDEFRRTGTVTFPAAMRTAAVSADGYLTLRADAVIFSRFSGSEITHTEIDLAEIRSFWPTTNVSRAHRDINKWWTVVRLAYDADVTVLACAPNGSTSLVEVLANHLVPRLES